MKFLLYNNEGEIRKALRPVILDKTHAQIVTRLPGNESIEAEGKAAALVQEQGAKLHLAEHDHGDDRRRGAAAATSTTTSAAAC